MFNNISSILKVFAYFGVFSKRSSSYFNIFFSWAMSCTHCGRTIRCWLLRRQRDIGQLLLRADAAERLYTAWLRSMRCVGRARWSTSVSRLLSTWLRRPGQLQVRTQRGGMRQQLASCVSFCRNQTTARDDPNLTILESI